MGLFERTFQLSATTSVLDVGGSADIWEYVSVRPKLVIANLPAALSPSNILQLAADGCRLPFRNGQFDIVFSNSVIEHVGSLETQRQFASELMRVGRQVWVQTPNRNFPVEQHLFVPLVHQLPKRWQAPVVRRITGWQLLTRPSQIERESYIGHYLNDIRLLRAVDLQYLFPGSRIMRESLYGVTKSLIAIIG